MEHSINTGGKMIKSVGIFLLAFIIIGCSSTTTITSNDKEAKIYVDGELKGTGSIVHTDTKIVGSTTSIKFQKEGCEPVNYTLTRSEEFDAGACAGGVFVLVPFLWVMKYKPVHSYEFTCEKR